ncbi:MAG: ABC transporter ATP-binding protein [Bacteroidetes bacterium]|nr:ABC transporter ATP-binding protein [Bacteroidota bacterium]
MIALQRFIIGCNYQNAFPNVLLQSLTSIETIKTSWNGIRSILSPAQFRRTLWVIFFSTGIATLDIIGLGSMVPVLMLAIDHSFLEKSSKLRAIYDFCGFHTEPAFLIFLILVILLFFILKTMLALWLYRYSRRTAASVAESLSSLSYSWAFQHNTFDSISRDGLGFRDTVVFTPYYFVSGVYMPFINLMGESAVIFMLTLVFTLYQPLAFLLIVGLLGTAFFLVNRYTRNRIARLGEAGSTSRDKALQSIDFGLSGFTDIKTHGVESFFLSRMLSHFREFAGNGIKAIHYQLIPSRINEVVALVGIIILVIYAYFFSDENIGKVRVLAALFVIAVFRLIPAANRMLQSLMHLRMNGYTVQNLKAITAENAKHESVSDFSKSIAIKDIHYKYPRQEQDVLSGVSMSFHRGEVIGLQGASGSGKTTLVKVLLGFTNPDSGEILVDDKVIEPTTNRFPLFGYMGQDPYIINGTVAENISFGLEPGKSEEQRMKECLALAAFQVSGFQGDLLHLQVGENGSMLSEGQKQRLVLAREIYRDVPVLILDEPSSALDSDTQRDLIKGLALLKSRGKTMLIIAHRPEMYEICDQVWLLNNGRLSTHHT